MCLARLVAAEIHLRGGYAAMFTGNMPDIDLVATDAARTRTIGIQVKTRTGSRLADQHPAGEAPHPDQR